MSESLVHAYIATVSSLGPVVTAIIAYKAGKRNGRKN